MTAKVRQLLMQLTKPFPGRCCKYTIFEWIFWAYFRRSAFSRMGCNFQSHVLSLPSFGCSDSRRLTPTNNPTITLAVNVGTDERKKDFLLVLAPCQYASVTYESHLYTKFVNPFSFCWLDHLCLKTIQKRCLNLMSLGFNIYSSNIFFQERV